MTRIVAQSVHDCDSLVRVTSWTGDADSDLAGHGRQLFADTMRGAVTFSDDVVDKYLVHLGVLPLVVSAPG